MSRVTCLASEVVSVHQGRVSSVPDVDVVTGVEKVILLLYRSEDKANFNVFPINGICCKSMISCLSQRLCSEAILGLAGLLAWPASSLARPGSW